MNTSERLDEIEKEQQYRDSVLCWDHHYGGELLIIARRLLKDREALLTCIRESIKDIEEGCYAMDALARLRAALEV